MASKRMFSNAVIDRDDFCMLSIPAQLLYFHLNLKADDDGFVPTMKILRILGFDEKPLEELETAGFIIRFPAERVVVIWHWLVNNELKRDRYHATPYQGLKKLLLLSDNKIYERMEPNSFQSGTGTEPQEAQPSGEKEEKPSGAQRSPDPGRS